jgi:hypothetical protein
MIPNVFVSSTVEDLHHLRDAVRDVIADLAYIPVMSEYGDVGYLPSASAEDSCYLTIRQCQLAILLIGKRYGSIGKNDLSITHNEFRAARDQKLPVFCLIDQDVLSFKRVYDANTSKEGLSFPGMDNPQKTFDFIQEFLDSPVNNGFQPFSNVSETRFRLKVQLAHFVGDLLRSRFSPINSEIKDILSEIKTLRHELKVEPKSEALKFLKTIRFLLDDHYSNYRDLIKHLYASIDLAIPDINNSDTFEEFVLKATGAKLEIQDLPDRFERGQRLYQTHTVGLANIGGVADKDNIYIYTITKDDRHLIVNRVGFEMFSSLHLSLRKAVETSA